MTNTANGAFGGLRRFHYFDQWSGHEAHSVAEGSCYKACVAMRIKGWLDGCTTGGTAREARQAVGDERVPLNENAAKKEWQSGAVFQKLSE